VDSNTSLVLTTEDRKSLFTRLKSGSERKQQLSYRRDSWPLRLAASGRQTTSIHRHGPKKLGRAAVPLWVGGAGWRITADVRRISVSSTLRRWSTLS